jgi:hypothetical protein
VDVVSIYSISPVRTVTAHTTSTSGSSASHSDEDLLLKVARDDSGSSTTHETGAVSILEQFPPEVLDDGAIGCKTGESNNIFEDVSAFLKYAVNHLEKFEIYLQKVEDQLETFHLQDEYVQDHLQQLETYRKTFEDHLGNLENHIDHLNPSDFEE